MIHDQGQRKDISLFFYTVNIICTFMRIKDKKWMQKYSNLTVHVPIFFILFKGDVECLFYLICGGLAGEMAANREI